LKFKGVDYEYVEEDLRNKGKSELLLQSNPVYGKVPVLLHAGRAISESSIILEYIDDVWTAPDFPPILASDPYDRADAKFWAFFIGDKFSTATKGMLRGLTEAARAAHVEEFRSGMLTLENVLAKCGEGERFFGGDDLGYVDIILGSALGWIRAIEKINELKLLDATKTPLLVNWAERFCAHSAVEGLIPEPDKLVQLSMLLKPMWKAQTEATIVAAGGVPPPPTAPN